MKIQIIGNLAKNIFVSHSLRTDVLSQLYVYITKILEISDIFLHRKFIFIRVTVICSELV